MRQKVSQPERPMREAKGKPIRAAKGWANQKDQRWANQIGQRWANQGGQRLANQRGQRWVNQRDQRWANERDQRWANQRGQRWANQGDQRWASQRCQKESIGCFLTLSTFFSLDPERSDDSCRVLRCRLPSVTGDDDDSWTLDGRQLVLQKDDSWSWEGRQLVLGWVTAAWPEELAAFSPPADYESRAHEVSNQGEEQCNIWTV